MIKKDLKIMQKSHITDTYEKYAQFENQDSYARLINPYDSHSSLIMIAKVESYRSIKKV